MEQKAKPAAKDLIGQRFGRLTVIKRDAIQGQRKIAWLCDCECGAKHVVTGTNLTSGRTKSCGCLRDEVASRKAKTHGKSGSPVYSVWLTMVARCHVPTAQDYRYYGARGIRVCERWRDFENFYADMGDKPIGKSIDRADNNGDYTPENCRWVSQREQNRNTRRNVMVVIGGEKACLSEWAERNGIKYPTIMRRINRLGWSPEDAVTVPAGHQRPES